MIKVRHNWQYHEDSNAWYCGCNLITLNRRIAETKVVAQKCEGYDEAVTHLTKGQLSPMWQDDKSLWGMKAEPEVKVENVSPGGMKWETKIWAWCLKCGYGAEGYDSGFIQDSKRRWWCDGCASKRLSA